MEAVNREFSKKIKSPAIPFSVLILAAGNSGRMGVDKALLPFNSHLSFINYLENSYLKISADPIILVVNEKLSMGFHPNVNSILVLNKEVEKGRSHSIRLGIQKVPLGHSCFIQNVDNPFVDPDLIFLMMNHLQDDSMVVPMHNDRGGHPLLISSTIVDYLRGSEDWSDFRTELQRYRRICIPWNDKGILLNINKPAEYKYFIDEKQVDE